jgi:transcriptional regulator with XRE-family HTH domain
MKEKDKIIWNNVETLRKKKGWSYTDLAKNSGTTTQHINKVKRGVRGIGTKTLEKFAKAFQVDVKTLLTPNGTNELSGIENGAKPINGVDDVLNEVVPKADYKLNTNILSEIIFRLEKVTAKHKIKVPAKQKAKLISLLYEHFMETGKKKVDPETVVRYLELIAA